MTQEMMHEAAMNKLGAMLTYLAYAATIEELRVHRSRAKGAVDMAYYLDIIEEEERDNLYETIMNIYSKRMDKVERW